MTTPTTPVAVPTALLLSDIFELQKIGLTLFEIAGELDEPLSVIHAEINAWLKGFAP
jgi:hypothetical protein